MSAKPEEEEEEILLGHIERHSSQFNEPLRSESEQLPLPNDAPTKVQGAQSSRLFNCLSILLNTVATIATIFLNKIIFSDPQLKKCQILFAIWHFLATFVVLFLSSMHPFRIFEALRLPFLQMIPICALFASFLILNNLSLTFNAIGFYQLAKILTAPTLVFFNFILFSITVSRTRLIALAFACIGVALTSSKAAIVNPLGAALAAAAFSITALYQIWIGKKMEDFQCSAPQLLLNQAPLASMLLLPFVSFFDTLPNIFTISPKILWCVVASGITASMINLSQFLIIGGTSALTFNIVGLIKTLAIVSLGWVFHGQQCTIQDIVGVILALGGAWFYAQASSK